MHAVISIWRANENIIAFATWYIHGSLEQINSL